MKLKYFSPLIIALIAALIVGVYSYYFAVQMTEGPQKPVYAQFLAKDIYVDGVHTDNFYLDHPVLRDTVSEEKVFSIEQALAAPDYMSVPEELFIPLNGSFTSLSGICAFKSAEVVTITRCAIAENCELSDALSLPAETALLAPCSDLVAVCGNEILPFSSFDIMEWNDCLYIRLSSLCSIAQFGVSWCYDPVSGFYISSGGAQAQINENNASFIEGRAMYMQHIQRKLSDADAYYLEYLFRKEATINECSEDLLLALCRLESAYTLDVKSKAIGIMQIMPSTATGSGWTVERVSTLEGNIEFGSLYICDRIKRFKGDEIKALSAYNQGLYKVLGGNYSTAYAQVVVSYKDGISAWCKKNDYSNEFERNN